MATVAEIALHGAPVLRPDHGFRTNVYAYAKRDLRPGETLDGIGGYTCYGLIENCSGRRADPGLPICLAEGVTLKRAVGRDERIALADVEHDAARPDFEMFARASAIGR
jgi:predicted homoserine dehydrogenase-like protein